MVAGKPQIAYRETIVASADGEVDRLEEAFHVGLARRLEVDSHRAKELRDAMNQRISLAP